MMVQGENGGYPLSNGPGHDKISKYNKRNVWTKIGTEYVRESKRGREREWKRVIEKVKERERERGESERNCTKVEGLLN